MTESEQATVEKKPAGSPPRDLSLSGLILILSFCLLTGFLSSVVIRLISNAITGGVFSRSADKQVTIDSTKQKVGLDTFKRIDVKELEDGLHMAMTTQAMLKMDYGKALSEIHQVSPGYRKAEPGVQILEVECLLSLKQSDSVVEIANKHLAEQPLDYSAWLWRAEAYEQLRKYQAAISDYEQALGLFTRAKGNLSTKIGPLYLSKVEAALRALVYRRMGACYERLLQYKEAALNYEKAIACTFPDLGKALDVSASKRNPPKRALTDLDNVIMQRPEDSGLYVMRGKAYKNLGQFELALADFDKAVSLTKGDPAAILFERSGVNFALNHYKEAAHDLRKVHADDPLYEMAHMRQKKYSLAMVPVSTMKKSQILSVFDKQIAKNPRDEAGYFHRGIVEFGFREYEECANDLAQFLSQTEDKQSEMSAKASVYLALCRGQTKRRSEYDAILKESMETFKNQSWWHGIIAFLADEGVTESALLAAAKENIDRTAQAEYFIGQKWQLHHNNTRAEEHFREVLKIGPVVDEYYMAKLAMLPDIKESSMMDAK